MTPQKSQQNYYNSICGILTDPKNYLKPPMMDRIKILVKVSNELTDDINYKIEFLNSSIDLFVNNDLLLYLTEEAHQEINSLSKRSEQAMEIELQLT